MVYFFPDLSIDMLVMFIRQRYEMLRLLEPYYWATPLATVDAFLFPVLKWNQNIYIPVSVFAHVVMHLMHLTARICLCYPLDCFLRFVRGGEFIHTLKYNPQR